MTRAMRWTWLGLVLPILAAAAEPAEPPPAEAPAGESSTDPLQVEIGELAAGARAFASSPRAIAWLARLDELRDEVSNLQLLAQPYAQVLFGRSTHPEVRRAARMLLADIERARGRLQKSHELLEPLGFVHSFYVLGSFDNEGKAGCGTDFGPESSLDLSAVYPTRQREIGWRPLDVASPDGYVDLSGVVRPKEKAVAYALALLEAPSETRVELSVGASGAFRVWVNGEVAASEDRYHEPRPDQSRVAVRLRRGVNRVLLKLCQESGPLGFYLAQQRSPGASSQARPVLPAKLPPLERGPGPQPQQLPTAPMLLAREVLRAPNDARLRGDYATVLHAFRAFEQSEHADSVEADRAADAAPGDVRLQLLAALLHTDDPNLRRAFLVRALEAAPQSPLARLALAQHELDRRHPDRSREILERLVQQYPRFAGARLALAATYAALDEWPRAARLVEETLRQAPQLPRAVVEGARASRRMDRLEEAIARYRVAVALRFDNNDARRALAALLADAGNVQAAAHELEAVLTLAPFENETRLRLAELHAANGRLDDGLRLFAAARELSPDEPEVHERAARALLQAGRREEALAAFERALALRPQNPSLREALRALQGANASYGVEHAFEVAPLIKEADSYAGEDAVYLVDYQYTRVQPTGLSSRFHQVAVKVFTQRGADAFRTFPITYSPDRQEVQVLKVRITKPDGSVVESFGDADRNMNEPWSGMYYDARARELSFPSLTPGDVIELQYRLEDTARDNLLADYWGDVDYVQSTAAKLRYRYMVDMPASRPLYWNRAQLPPGITARQTPTEDGRVLYAWEASRVARVVPEPGMPGWAEVAATLHVSTYKTWDDVGRYWWGLVRDQLTPNEELRRTTEAALKGVNRADALAVV
ncbi:MAG TPA: DUF3857 domain-containing protein, partial [Myxococcaceae bacterium]|nr:DUF3857 domain-containing protein [Myxococcaceae bacterium]